MQVHALDRVVDDPQPESQLRLSQRVFDGAGPAPAAQVSDALANPQRDVNGMTRRDVGAPQMRDARTRAVRRPAGASALAAPGLQLEAKLFHALDLALFGQPIKCETACAALDAS